MDTVRAVKAAQNRIKLVPFIPKCLFRNSFIFSVFFMKWKQKIKLFIIPAIFSCMELLAIFPM